MMLTQVQAMANRWRLPLTVTAAGLFFVGLGFSITSLDLRWDQVSLTAILLIIVLGPFSLALAAMSLQLTARAVGRHIGFLNGVAVSAIGSIAELLPLPGGAMVRGAALMRAGAGLRESTWIVTLTAVLTLGMAAVLASLPLIAAGSVTGYAFLGGGAAGTFLSIMWIMRRTGLVVAAAMIATRLGILALGVVRVSAAFAAIGLPVGPIEAGLFVISTALGTTVAIVPAGLGVSEAIAAALASLIEVPPAAAFLAVALNRALGLCVSGTTALAFLWLSADHRPQAR